MREGGPGAEVEAIGGVADTEAKRLLLGLLSASWVFGARRVIITSGESWTDGKRTRASPEALVNVMRCGLNLADIWT